VSANVIALAPVTFWSTLRAYVQLTKPRIIVLLLITTVPAMMVAHRGMPSGWLVLATLVGGAVSAGGANAINCWYDRDIDRVMQRTRGRPLVTGLIRPVHALTFGVALGSGAFLFMLATTTTAAAFLSLGALLFYVFVYTIWLKRRTPQNIVIGSAAGAFPPVVGWAAVTGSVSLAPVLMFAIVFLWTPPHFWALSLRLEQDYAEAHIPMLPVTAGPAATRVQIFAYSIALVLVTLVLPAIGTVGAIYLAVAATTGGVFIWQALRLWHSPDSISPMALYKYSLVYLAVLFLALGADVAILG